jgi:aryl-alcohol dehydrogenase-like predicted oxidoreductase
MTLSAPGGMTNLAGHPVARIGYGAMQLDRPDTDRAAAVAMLRRVAEAGIRHIDTAHFYGSCNAFVRAALAPYSDDLVLVSKVGADRNGGGLVPAQQPAQLRAQVEANLDTLGTEQVPVVNLRRLDAPPGLIAAGEQKVDLDDQLAELAALRDAGKIGAIGLSNVSAEQLRQALPLGIACVQNSYSVLNRTDEPVLDLCREHGIAWVPFFPLGSAFANQAKVADDPTVVSVAAQMRATPAQVGLAWLLAHYENTLLIAGTANPEHLTENIAVGDLRLTAESVAALNRLAPVE